MKLVSCWRRNASSIAPEPWAQRAKLVRCEPEYGEIDCWCKEVTKGEILEAIRRGATTVDGVKRRTGAGMGSCQGGGCTQAIAELLAQELRILPESVTKDGIGSSLLGGGEYGNL